MIYIVKDDFYMKHLEGTFHSDSPNRLKIIYDDLPSLSEEIDIEYIKPRMAIKDELLLVHAQEYIEKIESINKFPAGLSADTILTEHSLKAAKLSVGGYLEAVDKVKIKSPIFCLTRPAGHHAEKNKGMGYCIFNNIAIAAKYAQERYGFKRIFICDFDVHHGNGIQHIFYDDPSVLFFSMHEKYGYPGTGLDNEIGEGAGKGYTINYEMLSGQGDSEYKKIFDTVLKDRVFAYEPELILVSMGFDAYKYDSVSGMNVTEYGFVHMAMSLMRLANACCGGNLIFGLEGGYDLMGIKKCLYAILQAVS